MYVVLQKIQNSKESNSQVEMLIKCGMTEAKSVKTLTRVNSGIDEERDPLDKKVPYCGALGKIYLASWTRPDIASAVSPGAQDVEHQQITPGREWRES